jgi:hypothetical protein
VWIIAILFGRSASVWGVVGDLHDYEEVTKKLKGEIEKKEGISTAQASLSGDTDPGSARKVEATRANRSVHSDKV